MSNENIVPGFDQDQDSSLSIQLSLAPEMPGCLILNLIGHIDTYNSEQFQRRVQVAIENGYIKLAFNCANLKYISSTGIGAFTSLLQQTKSKGGNIAFANVQKKVMEVFDLLGFAQFFTIRQDVDSAVAGLQTVREEKPEEEKSIFPVVIQCPLCMTKLKTSKAGRFRCVKCKTILAINSSGEVNLG